MGRKKCRGRKLGHLLTKRRERGQPLEWGALHDQSESHTTHEQVERVERIQRSDVDAKIEPSEN